jgi:hypothetical protein
MLSVLAAAELLAVGGAHAAANVLLIAGTGWREMRHASPYARLAESRPAVCWGWTDCGRPIRMRSCMLLPPLDGRLIEAEDAWLRHHNLHDIVVRSGDAGPYCNCFGWVFTGGRFAIDDNIDALLEDNDYTEVTDPQPNDLAVYRGDCGSPMHVAVVRAVESSGEILVESKWGARACYYHPLHAYPSPNDYACVFYRSPRTGHILRGMNE